MSSRAQFTRPETLPEGFGKRNVVVLGAPSIGKTELFDRRERQGFCSVKSELHTAVAVSEDEQVVIDDFCRAYLSAGNRRRELLNELLNRENGVCLVTRPRSFDWLFESDEVGLSSEILSAIHDIYMLGYDPESDVDHAVDQALAVWDESGPNVSLDRNSLRDDLKSLDTHYEIENDRLQKRLGATYGPTLVPPLVLTFGKRNTDETLLPGAVHDVVSEASLNEFLTNTKDIVADIVTAESVAAAGASLIGGPAFAAAGGLLLWGYLREDRDQMFNPEATFGPLLNDNLLPTTKETLEVRLDLPPYTIDNLEELCHGETLREILDLVEAAPAERLDAFETEMRKMEADLEELQHDLTELESRVRRLEEFTAFEKVVLRRSVSNLDDLGEWLAADEAVLLGGLVDDVHPDDVDLYGESDSDDLVKSVVDAAEDGGFVVLKGPHGTGKTTAAYKALRRYQDRGYAVRIPDFSKDIGDIERALEIETGSEEVLVYVTYKRGHEDAQVSEGDLTTLFSWLSDGLVSGVLFECRDELYESLTLRDETSNPVWDHRQEVHFERLSDEQLVEEIVRWVADIFGWCGDVEAARDAVLRVCREDPDSEGLANPEIAKIASRFALADNRSLDDIDTADELVWRDIQTLFQGTDRIRDAQRTVVGTLAIVNRLNARDLADATDLNRADLEKCRDALVGYLGRSVRNEVVEGERLSPETVWRITPDIYTDVIFRYSLLHDNWSHLEWATDTVPERSLYNSRYDTIFGHGLEDGVDNPDYHYPEVASNLSVAYDAAQRRNSDALVRRVVSESNDLFAEVCSEDIHDALVGLTVTRLVSGGVPLSPDVLEAHLEVLINVSTVTADLLDTEPSVYLQNVAGVLGGSYLSIGLIDEFEHASALFDDLAEECSSRFENDSMLFLANVYSTVFAALADGKVSPDEREACIDEFTTLAARAAVEGSHDDDPGYFLANVYSMALKRLADGGASPDDREAWLNEFIAQADRTALEGLHDDTPRQFLAGVYSMAMTEFANRGVSPDEREAWIDELTARADRAAVQGSHGLAHGYFLQNVYSGALTEFANWGISPDEREAWLDELTARVDRAAVEGSDGFGRGSFLVNVYSMALTAFANRGVSPAEREAWLDELTERADRAAVQGSHGLGRGQFLQNMYSKALTTFANRGASPAEREAWLDELTERADRAAVQGSHDYEPGMFLVNVYSMALTEFANRGVSPDEREAWIDELTARADRAAVEGSHGLGRGQFLQAVYSTALKKHADGPANPDEREAWLDELTARVDRAAVEGSHDNDPEEFLANVYSTALLDLTQSMPPSAVPKWHTFLMNRAVAAFGVEELAEFYTAYFKYLNDYDNMSLEWISWLISDAVKRCFDTEIPIRNTESYRIDVVARLVADVVHDTYRYSGAVMFRIDLISSIISPLLELNTPRFAAVVSRTVDVLRGGDTSEWIHEYEEENEDTPTNLDTASDAFCNVAVAQKLAQNGPDDELHELISQSDGTTSCERIGDVYARAVRSVVADTHPDDRHTRVEELIDYALSAVDAERGEVYLACVQRAAADDERSPAWLPWFVGDALSRTVRTSDSLFGGSDEQVDVVARSVALVIHHRWKSLEGSNTAGDRYFERIVEQVQPVKSDDHQFFERVVSETAALLDEELMSGLAVFDWRGSFDDVCSTR